MAGEQAGVPMVEQRDRWIQLGDDGEHIADLQAALLDLVWQFGHVNPLPRGWVGEGAYSRSAAAKTPTQEQALHQALLALGLPDPCPLDQWPSA